MTRLTVLRETPASFAISLLVILLILGFVYSVINGMLYKIVPFLIWYHLQERMVGSGMKAPNVKEVIADRAASKQIFLHLAGLILLLAAAIWPTLFARAAAVVFGLSSAALAWNLYQAMRVYRRGLVALDAHSR